MKILITGAHFTTALAVVQELKTYPNINLVYVGRKTTIEGDSTKSVESQILPDLSIKFIPLITGRLQKSFTIYTIPSLLKIPIGIIQSIYILIKEKPDLILSFGGYVSVPIIFIGWLLSIPIFIHEQTLVTGLANKIGSIFADKIAISFLANHSFPKDKTILTGNPIRKEILEINNRHLALDAGSRMDWIPAQSRNDKSLEELLKTAKKEKLPVIFVTGGNQGSHAINKTIEESLDKLLKMACVIHQVGDSKFGDFERLDLMQNDRYVVKKFIYKDLPNVLVNTDLVISRAGMNTLAELGFLGIPTLVIPIPYLYQDEQNKNARFFQDQGLVKTLAQSRLNPENLLENIKEMIKNLDRYKERAKGAKSSIIPDAAKRLALEVVLMLKQ